MTRLDTSLLSTSVRCSPLTFDASADGLSPAGEPFVKRRVEE